MKLLPKLDSALFNGISTEVVSVLRKLEKLSQKESEEMMDHLLFIADRFGILIPDELHLTADVAWDAISKEERDLLPEDPFSKADAVCFKLPSGEIALYLPFRAWGYAATELAAILVHELVHYEQFASGELQPTTDGLVWRGIHYTQSPMTSLEEELEKPWEQPAYKTQWEFELLHGSNERKEVAKSRLLKFEM